MFKGTNRFLQSKAFRGRGLSGYPKTRKLSAGQNLVEGDSQFSAGTAYVKRLIPLIRELLNTGRAPSEIAIELDRQGISTPSGEPWTEHLAAELIKAVRASQRRFGKRARQKSTAKID